MEKGPHLRETALHPRLLLDHLPGLSTIGRRMLPQVSLQALGLLAQNTGLSAILAPFEPRNAFLSIGVQIPYQGWLAQTANAPDLVVGQIQALQIERLQLTLHFGVRVSVSLGFQSVGLGLGKFQLNHKGSFARCTQACVSRQLFNNDISRSKYSKLPNRNLRASAPLG